MGEANKKLGRTLIILNKGDLSNEDKLEYSPKRSKTQGDHSVGNGPSEHRQTTQQLVTLSPKVTTLSTIKKRRTSKRKMH